MGRREKRGRRRARRANGIPGERGRSSGVKPQVCRDSALDPPNGGWGDEKTGESKMFVPRPPPHPDAAPPRPLPPDPGADRDRCAPTWSAAHPVARPLINTHAAVSSGFSAFPRFSRPLSHFARKSIMRAKGGKKGIGERGGSVPFESRAPGSAVLPHASSVSTLALSAARSRCYPPRRARQWNARGAPRPILFRAPPATGTATGTAAAVGRRQRRRRVDSARISH